MAVLLGLVLFEPLPAAAQQHYKQLRYPRLRDLKLPAIERFQLPNELTVYLVEDHHLPKVEGYLLVKTGARWEPGDQVGLASMVGQVMRTGGTTTRKGEEIDRLLENVGAAVETGVGASAATASLFTLKENLPQVLEILADLLRNPAFPEDKLELAQVQGRTAIARRNDDVIEIANREFNKLIWGADSPYARHPEYATLRNIRRDDLVAFHRRYFHPNQMILGLWGDFNTAEAKVLVERFFGDWPPQELTLPPLPEVKRPGRASVNVVQKDDVNQTNLRLGHLGGRFDDPDYYAMNVMAEILGGGFTSRLFRYIRSELGLAYAVGAGWTPQYDYPGSFWVFCNTKSESTVRAIQEITKEVRRITREPVSAEELRVAKEGILNSFVFNFDTTGEIVRRLMTYEYYGYPRDFLEKFKANIEKVTAADVLGVAKEHLRPDELVLLAVGRQQDFDQPLSTLGTVNTIDIAIPPPTPVTSAIPPATPESLAGGREVLTAAIQAAGGLEALRSVRSISVLARVLQVTPQGEVTITAKESLLVPDKFRQDVVVPVFGEITLVYDGERAWQKSARGSEDLPPEQVERLRQSLARDPRALLLAAYDGQLTVQFLETTKVNESEVDSVAVLAGGGDAVRLEVEKSSGRILKQSFPGVSPVAGPVEEERIFSDFRPVGALTVPFKVVTRHNGQKVSERTVHHCEINIELDPKLFAREEGK